KKGDRPLVIITGDEKQRTHAKALVKEFIEKSNMLPIIGYTLLEVDNNKAKFQFIKFEGEDMNVHSKNREQYTVQLMKETKDNSDKQESDIVNLLSELEISPTDGFVTSEKLDSCLNEVSSQLSKADPTDIVRKDIR